MQRAEDIAMASAAPSELEDFLASVEEENPVDVTRRRTSDLVFGLLAIPVLFVGLVAAIIWIVPVVATWLPVVLDYISLVQAR